jgi:hypothetical protein
MQIIDRKYLGTIAITGNGTVTIPSITINASRYCNRNKSENTQGMVPIVNVKYMISGTDIDTIIGNITNTKNTGSLNKLTSGHRQETIYTTSSKTIQLSEDQCGNFNNVYLSVMVEYEALLLDRQGADYDTFHIWTNSTELKFVPESGAWNTFYPTFYATNNGFVFKSGKNTKLVIDKNGIYIVDSSGNVKSSLDGTNIKSYTFETSNDNIGSIIQKPDASINANPDLGGEK